ncbi:Fe-S cluster domain protein [Alkaliphilus metalliredigens QYMF]|uniref:Fe-S cluster domain protein n=1 Tax=Alkaliphilus metalliredigens (strain QYMF) TaxID=293826 RepID=A6TT03_ALKMQ|nr:[Fe-Fe] hydrogenase large subunit C-terminal domain-containing protein [Alkaliphilus metalliredigens]ABR49321.1 Fe-S cluster domain protein [Alkaliphilus metalliredigens QYMF]
MHPTIHGISLDLSKCVGCTRCVKNCPSEASRVRDGKSLIINTKCIHCGQCTQVCTHHARSSITNELNSILKYPYRIALVDPVLYSQFDEHLSIDQILSSIKDCGFHSIFETSQGADLVSDFTRDCINAPQQLPIISSSCPTIIRLIQMRYPSLIQNILPINSPVEIAAYMAKTQAIEKRQLSEEEIGVFYITPCTARTYSFQNPVGTQNSYVDGTFSIKTIFLEVSKIIGKNDISNPQEKSSFYPSGKGIGWARTGGESQSLGIKEYLAVDGIQNVVNVLDEVEFKKIDDVIFLECHACTGGCVGGCLTVINPFVARNRIRRLAEKHYANSPNYVNISPETFALTEPIQSLEILQLDEDMCHAIKKMEAIQKVLSSLPNIDCGACGSPSCRALAEDVVGGYASLSDCIVQLKTQLKK